MSKRQHYDGQAGREDLEDEDDGDWGEQFSPAVSNRAQHQQAVGAESSRSRSIQQINCLNEEFLTWLESQSFQCPRSLLQEKCLGYFASTRSIMLSGWEMQRQQQRPPSPTLIETPRDFPCTSSPEHSQISYAYFQSEYLTPPTPAGVGVATFGLSPTRTISDTYGADGNPESSSSSVAACSQSLPSSVTLSQGQHEVLKSIMQRRSVFYTGAAGTGKSFVIRILQELVVHMQNKDAIAFTAPTGVAACNIGGMTIHSWAGIGLGTDSSDILCARVNKNKQVKLRWESVEILVIDEISMVSADLFDVLNAIGQSVRNPYLPFGGIQVVLCGDFFQLPPVSKRGENNQYCFESRSWQRLFGGHRSDNKMIYLNKIFRQSDIVFVNILNEMRCGCLSSDSISFLQRKCDEDVTRELEFPTESQFATAKIKIAPTRLFSINNQVDDLNNRELNKLELPEVTYHAKDVGTEHHLRTLRQGLKVPDRLNLRVGAQVMLLKNLDFSRGLVNGTRGRVVEFIRGPRPGGATTTTTTTTTTNSTAGVALDARSSFFELIPRVEFYCTVGSQRFTEVLTVREEEWSLKERDLVVASRHQIPLMLAWAISIHKAQGMTIPFMELSFNRSFEFGQMYVGMSRAPDLEGLIIRHFDPSRIKANGRVVSFYQSIGFRFQTEDEASQSQSTITMGTDDILDRFFDQFPKFVRTPMPAAPEPGTSFPSTQPPLGQPDISRPGAIDPETAARIERNRLAALELREQSLRRTYTT